MNEIDYNSKDYQGRYTGYVRHVVEKPSNRKDCPICDGHGEVDMIVQKDGEEFSELRTCGRCTGSGDGVLFIYCFIEPDDKRIGDVFAHHREIEPERQGFKELSKGDFVEFDLVRTDRGLCARNIIIKQRKNLKRRLIREVVSDVGKS